MPYMDSMGNFRDEVWSFSYAYYWLTLKRKKTSHSSPFTPWYVAGCLGSHVPVASKGIQHVGLSGPGRTVPWVLWGISWKGNKKCWDPGSRRVENVELLGGDDCIQGGGAYLILTHIYLMGMVMNCRKTFKYGDDSMMMNPVVESHTNHLKQQMHKDPLVREITFFPHLSGEGC